MKPLSKSDPAVLCCAEESGEHIIASSGELHLEICLQDLQQDFNGETCQAKTSTCLAKSSDKRNHLFLEADTIGEELSNARIDNGDINPGDDPKIQGCKLADDFGWDVTEAHKIWAWTRGHWTQPFR
jgi:elongation factor 2